MYNIFLQIGKYIHLYHIQKNCTLKLLDRFINRQIERQIDRLINMVREKDIKKGRQVDRQQIGRQIDKDGKIDR